MTLCQKFCTHIYIYGVILLLDYFVYFWIVLRLVVLFFLHTCLTLCHTFVLFCLLLLHLHHISGHLQLHLYLGLSIMRSRLVCKDRHVCLEQLANLPKTKQNVQTQKSPKFRTTINQRFVILAIGSWTRSFQYTRSLGFQEGKNRQTTHGHRNL